MGTLTFDNVGKTYAGKVTAVKSITAAIEDGEFVVIVGPSGCGKSTLLRMVAGLESITQGEIRINDKVINKLEPAERDIAMVFQNYALYPHMSVFKNMAYGLKIQKKSRAEIDRRVHEAAKILELEPLLARRPRELSGGQRQRVAMGRAIVREPAVFLFDEPLSNLDAKLRVQMRMEIQALHKRLGTTSLYVTHDQVEAMTLAHRMVVMNQGKPEQIGTPAEVFERPASCFVASFIGSPAMNLLDVEVDARGVRGQHHCEEHLPYAPPSGLQGKAIMGVRPEHLLLGAPGDRGFNVQVELVEVLGSEQLVYTNWGDTRMVMRCDTAHATALAAGDKITLVADDAQSIHWFDADTQRRLDS